MFMPLTILMFHYGFDQMHQVLLRAKLLSPKDLIIILADSFFSDVSRLENYTTKEDFKNRLEVLRENFGSKAKVQNNLNEDDIWDISKYFKENFNKFSHYVAR